MGTAAIFSKEIHGELNAHGAWFPVSNTLLGEDEAEVELDPPAELDDDV